MGALLGLSMGACGGASGGEAIGYTPESERAEGGETGQAGEGQGEAAGGREGGREGDEQAASSGQAGQAGGESAAVDPRSGDWGPEGPIPLYADGERVRGVTEEVARRRGLSLVNLGEEWTPAIFTDDPAMDASQSQPYRQSFLHMANERFPRNDPHYDRPRRDRYLELYGIFPTLTVLRERLADEERHRCHDQVDDSFLERLEEPLRPGSHLRRQRVQAAGVRRLRQRLEAARAREGLDSIDQLADHRSFGDDLRRLREWEVPYESARAVQGHLRCEDLLPRRSQEGVLDYQAGVSLRVWQRRHMIVAIGGQLDDVTRRSFLMDSRELDLLSLLRALRERVISATGLIEDGSAAAAWGEVVGRRLDIDDELRWVATLGPMPGGAPDLIAPATDAAARALGWTDPAAALAWLNEHAASRSPARVVAIRLPERPAYHSANMELRAEIDRGDVWYGFPYDDHGRPRGYRVRHRPTLTLYVHHDGRDIPLVRWNTTIGGWQEERAPDGTIGMRYKNSDVGPRIWRDIIASPSWLPPPSTPDGELIVRRGRTFVPNQHLFGPSYASAYGLAMVIHHRVRNENEDGTYDVDDNGIRSHGSVSYQSILRSTSHGCHRLFNHLAVRLTSFLLTHRPHTRHGRLPAAFRRTIEREDQEEPIEVAIDQRGYLFQLDPPVPVEVLPGRIRGEPSRPIEEFMPLPSELAAEAQARAEAASNGGQEGEGE